MTAHQPTRTSLRLATVMSLLALLLLVTIATGCGRGDDDDSGSGDVQVDIRVEPDPPEVGPATITVTLRDDDGEPVESADLEIEGNMSHAGMTPVVTEAGESNDGNYVADDFEFTMGGDWIVTVRGELSDGTEIERTFDITGVEG